MQLSFTHKTYSIANSCLLFKIIVIMDITKYKVFTICTWVQDEHFMNFTTYVYAYIYVCLYMFICIYADAVYVYKIRLHVCMYAYIFKEYWGIFWKALISFDLFLTWSSLPVYSEKLGMKRTPLYLNQTSIYTTEQSTCLDEKTKEGALLLELIIHKMQ